MDINQFAVYQLKNGPETRQMRFRSYEKLQQSGIQVRYEYYREVYLGKMQRQDTPENIRERLQKKIPKSFDGHSLSVSDVLVLNREGEITAYYVEKEGFTVIAGFIRIGSSGALLTFETTNFHIEGKAGSWLVLDTLIIDGREFFLMEHMEYGRNAAYIAQKGKCAVTHNALSITDMVCMHIKPCKGERNDTYRNLIILSKDVSKLVDATENKVLKKLLQNLTLTVEMQEKINKLRKHRELEEIQFEDYIGTKM